MGKVRVPCFVLYCEKKTQSRMSLFAIFDDKEKIKCEDSSSSIIKPLLPFTGFKSPPVDCTFASFEDKVYVIGGSTLPSHLQFGFRLPTEEKMKLLNHKCREYAEQHSFGSLQKLPSTRVLWFEPQKCLENNNQMGEVEFAELDEVSKADSLSIGRWLCHILHLRGKLYAIGGNRDGPLVEVYHQGVWTPLKLHHSSHIDARFFVSVAIEEENMILIGSNRSFFKIYVAEESVQEWKGVECPEELVQGSFQRPGVVIRGHYALWYDALRSCIRLLDLHTQAHFTVELPENVLSLDYQESASSARFVHLGEGVLCLIFTGPNSLCEHGIDYPLLDFHCVKFEIIFHRESEGRRAKRFRKSFPAIRLISHRKCYAPAEGFLCAAFAMDVHLPQKKNLFDTSYFEGENLKYRLRA